MSDRFDITLERKLESNGHQADDDVIGVRRIELITGAGRRRRWSSDDKARIVVESLKPGAIASEVARRNGLSPQQLFAWRREAHALFNEGADATLVDPAASVLSPQSARRVDRRARPLEIGDDAPVFAPVVLTASVPSSLPTSSQRTPTGPGTIEITIGDCVVRITGEVETAALVAVLRALRRTP